MTMASKFKEDRYLYIKDFFTDEERKHCLDILKDSLESGRFKHDGQCPNSISFPWDDLDNILHDKKPLLEEITGLELIPTYSYARIYPKGEILKNHVDRPCCEISITMTLDYTGELWPIYFLDKTDSVENINYWGMYNSEISPYMDTSRSLKFMIKKGDGVLYRGSELFHWRDEYVEGESQTQAFFHYVNANGPYRYERQTY